MTPEAQRIAIAKACPDTFYIARTGGIFWRNAFLGGKSEAGKYGGSVDPLNDLNAMHEVEKTLSTESLRGTYHRRLVFLADGKSQADCLCHATAPQRAKAFLETILKWDDSPQ